MLKITLHDGPEAVTFQVEGKLVGLWAHELEQAWNSAAPLDDRKARIVDLTETLYIDPEGKRILGKLFREGAFFRTSGPLTRAVVDEITGPSRKRWPGPATQALLLLIVCAGFARSADPLRLTLRDAVQLALKQNPQVQIANLNIAQSQENSDVARSALLPQIALNGSEEVRRANLAAQLGLRLPGFPGHIGPFWVTQGGTSFGTPLFDLAAWRRWRASKENVTGARSQEQTIREETVQLVVSQYLGTLRAAADVQAAQSRVNLAKALFDQASDLQKNGVGTRIDTLRSNVQLQNEQQRLLESQTQLKTSLYGLARLLNVDPHQDLELTDQGEFFQTPQYAADQTMERAFESRPEMKTLASQIRAQQLEKRSVQDERLPRISVNGFWALQGLSPTSAIPAYQYAANLDVPLFTGGRIKAQTAVADIELKKLAQQQTDLRNRIALEVKTAVAQLDAAKSEVDVANLGVELAKEEVTQARDRFQAGVANNIEVITAQDELARANDNQITALYRYNQARADVARATGQMESLYAK